MLLSADAATNFNNVHLCIPMQIKKRSSAVNDIDYHLMTVNNFFAHFVKEIDIRRYLPYLLISISFTKCAKMKTKNEIRILLTNNTVDIFRHNVKYVPDDALKTNDEILLYSKKAVKVMNNVGRGPNNTENSRTDDNLDNRIDKFHDLLTKKKDLQTTFKIFNRFRFSKFSDIFPHKVHFYLRVRFKQVV